MTALPDMFSLLFCNPIGPVGRSVELENLGWFKMNTNNRKENGIPNIANWGLACSPLSAP